MGIFMQNNLGSRVKFLREKKGLTQTGLGKLAKVSQGAISQLENGTSKDTKHLSKIAKALNVTTEYLTDGREMVKSEMPSFDDFVIIGGDNAGQIPTADEYVMIPQYDVHGSCGPGNMIGDVTVKGGLVFKRDWVKGVSKDADNLATIYAQGDSMSPTINDGQVLLVDTTEITPKTSKIYLVCIDGQLYIKRLINMIDRWVMRSDNPDKTTYPDIELSHERMAQIDIQGRVVWQGGLL